MLHAKKDPRVRGIVVSFPTGVTVGGTAQLQELREAIASFNSANKFSIAFAGRASSMFVNVKRELHTRQLLSGFFL